MENHFIEFYTSDNFPGLTEHPERRRLDTEFHARPPIPLEGPTLVSHLVFLHDSGGNYMVDLEHLDRFNADGSWEVYESTDAYRW